MGTDIETAERNRDRELETLSGLVCSLEHTRGDQLDILGMLRLAEIQIGVVRRALVAETRATGWSWRDVGLALGLTGTEAAEEYAPRHGA